MSTAEWYYLRNGQQAGPVGSGQLKQLAARGGLQPHDLVWRDGLSNWVPAARVKGLFPDAEYVLVEDEAQSTAAARAGPDADDEFQPEARRPRKALRYGYAGFWKRLFAFVIDHLVLMGLSFGVGLALGFVLALTLGPNLDVNQLALIGNGVGLVLFWLYFTVQESSESQATVGKRALHIKVTDEFGQRISFARANGRFFGKFLSGALLGLGYLMAAFTERKQALHDLLAHTLVVND
jgi:uncharacterized RDD family membrane protein YckC